jgi:micrococcal nuclease
MHFKCCAMISLVLAVFVTPALSREIRGTAGVRDGDTIVVAGTPVRLNGVDAPETSNRYGREATTFMRRLVSGRTVTCDLNGDRTYDRWVGVCYIEYQGRTVDVGAMLIGNGYALDCRRYSRGRYRSIEPAGARSRLPQAAYC